jgi:hypothetical protein
MCQFELPTDKQGSSTPAPRSGDGGRRSAANGEPSVSEAEGPQALKQSLRAHHSFPGPRTPFGQLTFDVSIRTPDRLTREFDNSFLLSLVLPLLAEPSLRLHIPVHGERGFQRIVNADSRRT